MDRHMKIYDFPENQRMELNDGIYSIASKFAVESVKKFDGMICDEIAREAKNAGVTKLAILDAKGIVEAFKRLAAYEDTGLEPQEITEAQEWMRPISFNRIREIMNAEAEGRLVMLPFLPNKQVWDYSEFFAGVPHPEYYTLKDSFIGIGIDKDGKRTFEYDCVTIYPEEVGKTIFLTREEAEEALRRKNESIEFV